MKFKCKNIRKLRADSEMTQQELMKSLRKHRVNVTLKTIQNWEHGVHIPNAECLAAMAMIFGVSVTIFFDRLKYNTK